MNQIFVSNHLVGGNLAVALVLVLAWLGLVVDLDWNHIQDIQDYSLS